MWSNDGCKANTWINLFYKVIWFNKMMFCTNVWFKLVTSTGMNVFDVIRVLFRHVYLNGRMVDVHMLHAIYAVNMATYKQHKNNNTTMMCMTTFALKLLFHSKLINVRKKEYLEKSAYNYYNTWYLWRYRFWVWKKKATQPWFTYFQIARKY